MIGETLNVAAWTAGGMATGYGLLRAYWATRSAYRLRQAGPRPIGSALPVLWRDPGDITRLDLASGPGGPTSLPAAPFQFIEEHSSGTQPCVSVRDANGRRWRVKWGAEVRSESFAVRLAWACGYFAEITHFVASGQIDGVQAPLTRAGSCVEPDGRFVEARFELDDPAVDKFFEEHSWSWTENPFVGTRELAGLRILLMLISNWDNKDQRDVARGSNTGIYLARDSRRRRREAQYLVVDWGGSMGRWGRTVVTRGRWDAEGFAAETPQFVTGVVDGFVQFGYTGQRTGDARTNIRVEDVAWLCRYLGQITDSQLREALDASGASSEETESFAASLRSRIDQLVNAAALPARWEGRSTDPPAMDGVDSGRAALS